MQVGIRKNRLIGGNLERIANFTTMNQRQYTLRTGAMVGLGKSPQPRQ